MRNKNGLMNFDYIIIGAGVIGSSTAYHLKKGLPGSKILLIDRNHSAGAGTTAKSAALYRNFFSSRTNRMLAASSIKYWVKYLNEKGFEGLREEKRSGRPSVTDGTLLSNIDSDLRQNPTAFGYTNNLWDGKMLSHHLKKKYDIKLGVRQCQRLFNQLDFRLRKQCPVIAKSDGEANAEFSK